MEKIQLNESVTGRTGGTGAKRRAKIIEGDRWGSSAYYPAEVVKRDAPLVVKAGTQMFADHLSESEKYERPEGSVHNLVGKLTSDAAWEDDGPDGPGLYADVQFYESFVPRINEIGDDIGLSLHGEGYTEWGEAAGREGPILTSMLSASSVDVVTRAGAGGKLTSILESDRELAGRPVKIKEGNQVTDITKEDFQAFLAELKESNTALVDGFKTALTESAAAHVPAEEKAEKPAAKAKKSEEEEPKKTEVEESAVDQAAVIKAVVDADLPAEAATPIVESIRKGVSLEDAVKVQTDYRDAIASRAGSGVITLEENGSTKTGLARAVELLG